MPERQGTLLGSERDGCRPVVCIQVDSDVSTLLGQQSSLSFHLCVTLFELLQWPNEGVEVTADDHHPLVCPLLVATGPALPTVPVNSSGLQFYTLATCIPSVVAPLRRRNKEE